MISEDQRQKLNSAAVEVFGTMYYTPVELLDDIPAEDQWQLEEKYVRTAIDFTGPHESQMRFYFPFSLAVSIAGGFLGQDEADLSQEQINDTMKESANMIVGNFLGRLDPEGACKLGIPIAETISNFSPGNSKDSGDILSFTSDFGYVWVTYKN